MSDCPSTPRGAEKLMNIAQDRSLYEWIELGETNFDRLACTRTYCCCAEVEVAG
jgi:hypothetical protein